MKKVEVSQKQFHERLNSSGLNVHPFPFKFDPGGRGSWASEWRIGPAFRDVYGYTEPYVPHRFNEQRYFIVERD